MINLIRRVYTIAFFTLAAILCTSTGNSQTIINAYAKVTNISSNVLTLSNINETNHTFSIGGMVIVMQMQDNTLGGTNNNTNFGTLGSIGSAGLYEVRSITGKTATTLTLNAALTNTYNTGSNSSVQVISYRLFGSPDYSTTFQMTALDWDGNVGGVLAFYVNGKLTLNHSISVNGNGFRGGSPSTNDGVVDCATNYITNSSGLSGEKGEGIFKRTDANQRYGRAKILNGGGGGNRHNAGGGGGGNVTAGGVGGPGYMCSASPVGGQGGISLNSVITNTRIFMGGGGGGGQQNNSVASSGADGGGIIFIRATQIITTGTCTSRSITANGANANNGANDGMGGGGAGGSIILDVDSYNLLAACPLVVTANGGAGGTCNDPTSHGGGGGGGQGRVIFSGTIPSNTSSNTNNGTPGCNNASCSSAAGMPTGTNGAGVSNSNGITPLPVTLLYFSGLFRKETGNVELSWATASELNSDSFSVERSSDGITFKSIATIQAKGTTNSANTYHFEDFTANDNNAYYYQLTQRDIDGTIHPLKIIRVDLDKEIHDVWIYPNPAVSSERVTINFVGLPADDYQLSLINSQGIEISKTLIQNIKGSHLHEVETQDLEKGMYTIKISSPKESIFKRILIQ